MSEKKKPRISQLLCRRNDNGLVSLFQMWNVVEYALHFWLGATTQLPHFATFRHGTPGMPGRAWATPISVHFRNHMTNFKPITSCTSSSKKYFAFNASLPAVDTYFISNLTSLGISVLAIPGAFQSVLMSRISTSGKQALNVVFGAPGSTVNAFRHHPPSRECSDPVLLYERSKELHQNGLQ